MGKPVDFSAEVPVYPPFALLAAFAASLLMWRLTGKRLRGPRKDTCGGIRGSARDSHLLPGTGGKEGGEGRGEEGLRDRAKAPQRVILNSGRHKACEVGG